MVIRHSSFVIHHLSFAIRHSSLVICNSPFVIRHSSYAIRHSLRGGFFSILLSMFLALLMTTGRAPALSSESAAAGLSRLSDNEFRSASLQGKDAATLAGLLQPVEILKDRWGVSHIYARNTHDLFFAQGYNAASDRLWQMEMWRRIGEGSIAELTGIEDLPRDRFARLMKYRGDLEAEFRSYAPDAKKIMEAFVAGVNSYIDFHRGRWPVEFRIMGIEPQHWAPETCLLRMAGYVMTRNASSEILRARLIAKLGTKKTEEIMPTDPYQKLEIPSGLDLAAISEKILQGSGADGLSIRSRGPSAQERGAASGTLPYGWPAGNVALDGSNNWTVSGNLSTTGRPILANDPHRTIGNPSLRYLVHLNAPGWNIIGAGEPALPGIAVGHNERIAFGFTVVGIDQQDIYVYETAPEDPKRYRYQNQWVGMTSVRETFLVKGSAPVTEELRFTRHGPVLYQDTERHLAYALRWVGTEPGSAGYLASLSLDRAGNWLEFLEALKRWKVPSENIAYADVDGNIGWQAAGLAPVRKGWNGLLPVRGSGEYEWRGFLSLDQLPRKYNPPEGFIATANHKIIPEGYPHAINFEWSSPFRFQRIEQVLKGAERRFSLEDFERLQHDVLSLPAMRMISLLRETMGFQKSGSGWTSSARDDVTETLLEVANWNGVLAENSRAALLYEIWNVRIPTLIVHPQLSSEIWRLTSSRFAGNELILALLSGRTSFYARDQSKTAELMRQAMRETLADLVQRLGPDKSKWTWGALHKAEFRHPLSGFSGATNFDLGPISRSGDGTTVNATGGANFKQTSGASYREIIDLADWDRSVIINTPGQSGVPGSAHYADLLPLWQKGEYFPMLFTRAKVEAATSETIVLRPKR
jgi:penicillin amidase